MKKNKKIKIGGQIRYARTEEVGKDCRHIIYETDSGKTVVSEYSLATGRYWRHRDETVAGNTYSVRIDHMGSLELNMYNGKGQKVKTIYGSGEIWQNEYCENGTLKATIKPDGERIEFGCYE